MSSAFLFGVMFIAAVWAIGGYLIWEFGPGDRIRSVRCPVLKKRATILADLKESRFAGSYAGLTITDVKLCSLLDKTHLACHKECIFDNPRPAQAGD
jgi:hypothetical protein